MQTKINPYTLLVTEKTGNSLFIIQKGDFQQIVESPTSFYGDGWKLMYSLHEYHNRVVIRDEVQQETLFVLRTKKSVNAMADGGFTSGLTKSDRPHWSEGFGHGGKARALAEWTKKQPKKPKPRPKSPKIFWG